MNAEGNNQHSISDEKVNSYAEGIKISWIWSIDAERWEQRETDNKGVSDDIKMQELYMVAKTRKAIGQWLVES